MKETGADAVKLEGAKLSQIRALVSSGIPVMGHVGFTPQSVNTLAGYKVQGRTEQDAARILQECKDIEAAGAFAVVLEMIPAELARDISQKLAIPTIGIGAGADCDGQILVWQDFAGLGTRSPKFAKQYLNLRQDLSAAATAFRNEVVAGEFPAPEQQF
jgi:3-methyl-2-oxobutanoate hydroxymethyltransferase